MDYIKGLTEEEVELRIKQNKVNYDTTTPSRSIKQIMIENTFTLFNLINFILGVLVILTGSYKNLLFLGVVLCNTIISSIHEVKAKKIVDKLSIISSSCAKVIRDGIRKDIHVNEIVLDDIILFSLGDQILTDCKIVSGTCEVDESFITGESNTIYKNKGDILLSGSFIVSGNVTCKVIHVGLDNYTAVISKDAKIINKQVSSEIMKTLDKIVKYLSFALIPIGILLLLSQFNVPSNTIDNAIISVVAALVGMIPEGLILLVSSVLAISVVRLSKYNVLVQDIYAIEALARVDVLCLDKTGTITEGDMEVFDVIPVKNNLNNEIDIAMNAISTNLNDNNPTFKAINKKYGNNSKLKTTNIISFSSKRKYSKVIFKDFSYIIGAPEIVLSGKYLKYKDKIEKLSKQNRVLVLIKTTSNNKKEVLAFVLLKDRIRKEAINTLNYIKENDVDIKIISGDSLSTVMSIAKEVGIKIKGSYDDSLIDKDTDLNMIVEENNIFARVKPEQKRNIIKALKNNGHTVSMTGDGVNDVLALKESDCGIVLNDSSDAARNVSELVLLDSNFDSLPHVVKEGRRTINNIQRSATLFLSKTIYSFGLALIFLFIKYKYPFLPIQMSLISTLTIGIPAFILALEPNFKRIEGNFLINVISNAIPSAVTTVINILFTLFMAKLFNLSSAQTSTIIVAITGYTALLLIYKISKPLNLLRKSLLFTLIVIFIMAFITPIGRKIFSLEVLKLNSILILSLVMLLTTKIFNLLTKLLNIIIKNKNRYL